MKLSKAASISLLNQIIILEMIIFLVLVSWYTHRICNVETIHTQQRLNEEISQLDLSTSNYLSGVESIVSYIGELSISDNQSAITTHILDLLKSFRQHNSSINHRVITIRWLGLGESYLNRQDFRKRFDSEFCYSLTDDLIDQSISTPFKMFFGTAVNNKCSTTETVKIPMSFGISNNNNKHLGSFLMLLDMHNLQEKITLSTHDHPELSYAIFSKNGEIILSSSNGPTSAIQKHIESYLSSNGKNNFHIAKWIPFISGQSYQIRDLMIPDYEYKIIVAIDSEFTFTNLSQGLNLTILDLLALLTICASTFLFAKYRIANPIMHLSKTADVIASGSKTINIKSYKIKEIDNLSNSLRNLITQQHQLIDTNNKLKFALKQIEVVNRAKSEFMRNIQHDLRTPLNHIIGGTELIASQPIGSIQPEYIEYLNIINQAGNDLLSTINDIIAATDAEQKNIHLYEKTYDLKIVAKEVIESMMPQISQAKLKLKVHIDEDLPHVRFDAAWFKTVIFSLVDNSIKFSKPNGMLGIKLKRHTNGVVISITDTGYGMNATNLKSIRELFTNSSSPNNIANPQKNIGLGLTIVHNVLDLHNTKFSINSKINLGTHIRITIPNIRIKQSINSRR